MSRKWHILALMAQRKKAAVGYVSSGIWKGNPWIYLRGVSNFSMRGLCWFQGTCHPKSFLNGIMKKNLSFKKVSTVFLWVNRISRFLFQCLLKNISKRKGTSREFKIFIPRSLSFLLYCFLWHVALLESKCPRIRNER